jgi:hypothetical protein
MSRQSAVIRGCLGDPPYVFSTADRKKYGENGGADREFVHYVAPTSDERRVIDLSALGELRRPGKALTRPLVALHSYKEQDRELLREIVAVGSVADRSGVATSRTRLEVRTFASASSVMPARVAATSTKSGSC